MWPAAIDAGVGISPPSRCLTACRGQSTCSTILIPITYTVNQHNTLIGLTYYNYTSVEAGVYSKYFSLESDDHPRGQASQHQGSSDGGNVEISSNHSLQPCFLYRVTLGVLQAL